jgi:hypothetical protein
MTLRFHSSSPFLFSFAPFKRRIRTHGALYMLLVTYVFYLLISPVFCAMSIIMIRISRSVLHVYISLQSVCVHIAQSIYAFQRQSTSSAIETVTIAEIKSNTENTTSP